MSSKSRRAFEWAVVIRDLRFRTAQAEALVVRAECDVLETACLEAQTRREIVEQSWLSSMKGGASISPYLIEGWARALMEAEADVSHVSNERTEAERRKEERLREWEICAKRRDRSQDALTVRIEKEQQRRTEQGLSELLELHVSGAKLV